MSKQVSLKVVLMAGGSGARFWPRSSPDLPKQFLDFDGTGSLLRKAYNRALALVENPHIYVSTQRRYSALVLSHLPELPADNLILEPEARDTAPALGLVAVALGHEAPDTVIVALPSDHMVGDDEQFIQTLKAAVKVAESHDRLVTIGIHPSRPETGYGYIKVGEQVAEGSKAVHRVAQFTEKPTELVATEYVESGRYLWNAGMFVWRTGVFRSEVERHLPELDKVLREIERLGKPPYQTKRLGEIFSRAPRISIDYGLLERSSRVFVVVADFAWDDLGTWSAVARLVVRDEQGNSLRGPAFLYDSSNVFVEAGQRVVAAIGVRDLIVVDSENGLLICSSERAQDVKKLYQAVSDTQLALSRGLSSADSLAATSLDSGQDLVWAETPNYSCQCLRISAGTRRTEQNRAGFVSLYVQGGRIQVTTSQGYRNLGMGEVCTFSPGESYELVALTSAHLIQVSSGGEIEDHRSLRDGEQLDG